MKFGINQLYRELENLSVFSKDSVKKTAGEEFWKIAEKGFVLRFVVANIKRVLALHVQGMLITVIKWFS